MKNLFRKIRLYFINQEIENIAFWLSTNKTGGAKMLLRYARLKGIKKRLEA